MTHPSIKFLRPTILLLLENVDIRKPIPSGQGIILPISPGDEPQSSYRFICELPYGTEHFSSYWILPTGDKIVANDTAPVTFMEEKYTLNHFHPDIRFFSPPSSDLTAC